MVEIFIPPRPAPGRGPIRVEDDTDAVALLSAFVNRGLADDGPAEVVMIALGQRRELHAVVAFGDVALSTIVEDPRPLVALATSSSCSGVLLAQAGVDEHDVVDALRVVGSALEIDGIDLIGWVDLDRDAFRSCG